MRAVADNSTTIPTPDPTAGIDPHVLIGPMIIGLVLNVWLYGMQLIQTETYFRSSTKDALWVKILVVYLTIADLVNCIFDIWFTYYYNVDMFGNKLALLKSTWYFDTDPAMVVLISSPVQGFFAWRVKKLTGQTWLGICIGISAFAQLLLGIGTSIACGIVKDFVNYHKFKSIVIAWLVLAPITDIVIAVSLVFFLQRHKTGFAVTDDLVAKITRGQCAWTSQFNKTNIDSSWTRLSHGSLRVPVTIQTGAITAVWAVADLAIFLLWANNLHLIFNMPLAKLYSNCLLSSLNARREWTNTSMSTEPLPTTHKNTRGVHVTTTTVTGVHPSETYELDTRGRPFDGTPGTAPGDVKSKPIDDGLSLRSDSLNSDPADDAFGGGRKLVDEEMGGDGIPRQRIPVTQAQPMPNHPYVNVTTPNGNTTAYPVARGGRNEVNVEWAKAL
ncbi:hypothetical protein DL93DRAFT_2165615 [Clavulina sp. PMI_390]|nr:hypothetical protein DL93DRAFT_2165615 [Clavulina sp. PMI_390]